MANPRKFSEKIALLNQKEAEGNAEFERIMREVSEVSSKVTQAPHNTNLIAVTSQFISRSLPNVNAPINDTNKIIDNKDEPQTTLAGLLTTSGYSNDITKNGSSGDLKASSLRESRGRSVGGGPMRARSRNIDTSPYSSNNTAYLSPPESSWRRTSSDSAIHQSLAQAQDIHDVVHNSLMLSPRSHKRLSSSQSNSMKNLHQQQQHSPTMSQQHSHSQQNMPQSTFEQQTLMHQQHQQAISQHHLMNNLQQDMKSRSVSRLPGINVYPSQNDDTLQIPVGNSTGSLPDLTLVHYQQSPLSTPLDLEHDQLIAVTSSSFNTNSSYSMPMAMSTNQTTSNQLPSMGQHQIYHQMGSQQQNASNNLENFSPKHFNSNNSNTNNNSSSSNNKDSSSSQGFQGSNNNPTYTQQSSPIPIDTNHQRQQQHSPLHHQSFPNNQISAEKMMSYRNANTASPANLSSSQGNLSKISYRNSPHSRPSPGTSPNNNNVPGLSANFDSNSSAPCSPSPLTTGNNGQFDTFTSVDSFYINPSIQQHFEQFSLDWTSLVQSLVDSGCTISAEVKVDSPLPDYITSTNDQNYSQMNDNYNGMMDDSPNRQSSPTNRSSTPSSRTNARTSNNTNHMNSSSNSHHSNNGSSPHSPLSNDSMLTGGANYDNMNCDGLRNIMGSSALDGALLNGGGSGNGINDIMLGGGLGSDSSSKLITSSSAALQTSLMMSQTSPSHLINNTQTTNSIPEIVFSDYSSGSEFARDFLTNDNFLELGSTELQMFENANIIDPMIEDSFRRDLY